MKRTPWFPTATPPVRVGYYECIVGAYPCDIVMRYWSGKKWHIDLYGKLLETTFGDEDQGIWRGLTEEAK